MEIAEEDRSRRWQARFSATIAPLTNNPPLTLLSSAARPPPYHPCLSSVAGAILSNHSTALTKQTLKAWLKLWKNLTVTYRDGCKVRDAEYL